MIDQWMNSLRVSKLAGLLAAVLVSSSLASASDLTWTPAAKPWNRELGSHRIVVEAPEGAATVRAHLEWRRRDSMPEKKAVIVRDAATGATITNSAMSRCDGEVGDVIFETVKGHSRYEVYFLPVKVTGGAFPVGTYTAPQDSADPSWKKSAGILSEVWHTLPEAKVVAWEALNAHEAWNDMEVIATVEETRRLAKQSASQPFVVRLETRDHPVRMFDHLPQRWASAPSSPELTAAPDEHLAFQVVVWPPQNEVKDVRLKFSTLRGPDGAVISQDHFSNVHQPGAVDIASGRVQPLWCLLHVPVDAKQGVYHGAIQVTAASGGEVALPITLLIAGAPLPDHGDDTPEKLSRLDWLNSTLAEDEEVTSGYEPLRVDGGVIHCLGRSVTLADGGLPSHIVSHFNTSVTKIDPTRSLELLAEPMRFVCTTAQETPLILKPRSVKFTHQTNGAVEWASGFDGESIALEVHGRMEFDGSLNFRVTASGSREVGDIRLETPRTAATTRYSTGLGQAGGFAPDKLDWKWDVAHKHQDSLWLGAVNGGLRLEFKAENYARAAVNIHYSRRPLNEPPSWSNGGRGGIRYADHTLSAYSGPRQLNAKQPLHFDFDILVTPFHPLRLKEQFTERYYQTSSIPEQALPYLDAAAQAGANIINVHQGNWLNPYINYPFLTADKLSAFCNEAHARKQRVKFYYTVRELSNWTPELFALRSLGNEILLSGKGGGYPWLEEHLAGDYWQAWYEKKADDASLLNATKSRWDNYYIEGLRWLVEKAGCDGLYLDDISYDRSVMRRARKVLDRYCPRGGRIDLHSWNELNARPGFANCVNVFMDSVPFVDRLWFGEGHHYAGPPPEHMLVEISGIPFGLMGEMLEGGGNVWLGLTCGMTGRLGWGGHPQPVWLLWDRFGAADAEFIGWWADDCPVASANPNVKCSVWTKNGATLLAVGNFGKDAAACALEVNWKKLGLNPANVTWLAPSLGEAQREAIYPADHLPQLAGHAGAVFILSEKPPVLAGGGDNLAGEILWQDKFPGAELSQWKPVVSHKAGDKAMLANDGLIINAPANVHAFVERALPANASAVRVNVWQDPADEGQQWGPGLALVWPDGGTLRFNKRHDGRFSISANGSEKIMGQQVQAAPLDLIITWDNQNIRFGVGGEGMGGVTRELHTLPRSQLTAQGGPSILRVGKMPNDAKPRDFKTAGKVGFNRIESVKVFAPSKKDSSSASPTR